MSGELPRVVVVSPGPVLDSRRRELRRLFGREVEVMAVSHFEHDPSSLLRVIRDAKADAVVLGTAPPAHRAIIEALVGETPILRTRFEQMRNARGELEDRPAGLGLLRKDSQITCLDDGALA